MGTDERESLGDVCARGELSLATELVETGVSVDVRDENGWTPLMRASCYGQVEIVQFLLEHGANVDAEDDDAWTALAFAASEGHVEVVKRLVEKNKKSVDVTEITVRCWRSGHKDPAEAHACPRSHGCEWVRPLHWFHKRELQ